MLFNNEIFYPIINTNKFEETIRFYCDFFDFSVAFESDGFNVLAGSGDKKYHLGIMAVDHHMTDDTAQGPTKNVSSGTILNFFVDNIHLAKQQFEWQGADIVSDICRASSCKQNMMIIRDPNGLNITVVESERCKNDEPIDGDLKHLEKYVA